ncbi:hypothetical protein [Streptomyces sp. NPDC058595]|uniref:hypothetical protein n=1 Tax=Streptomyces sp. NPDC058595 TaxID=3346550 RepID=UPI00364CA809
MTTSSLPCNLFGTPTGKPGPWQRYAPIAPWMFEGHSDLWAPVDHVPQLLEKFQMHGPSPWDLMDIEFSPGHLVIVSGAPKTGKTSLIHHCVHDLAVRLQECVITRDGPVGEDPGVVEKWCERKRPASSFVVGLEGYRNQKGPSFGRARIDGNGELFEPIDAQILERVLETLRGLPEWDRAERESVLTVDPSKPYSGYHRLRRILINVNRCALIVVPHVPWAHTELSIRFINECREIATRGLVVFLEVSQIDFAPLLHAALGERPEAVTHLEMGALVKEDWTTYIRHRLAVDGIPAPVVALTDDVIDTVPSIPINTIGDMQTHLYEIAQMARREYSDLIDAEVVRRYFDELKRPDVQRRY